MQDYIAEIKARADIVQIISAHVPLKKAGKDFKARCPFHSEKTPSFTVSAEKQLFYCFGCGSGGDVIKFVSLIEKIDNAEAIRRLADRFGIERRRGGDSSGRDAPAEPLRRALELAAQYYEAALASPAGEIARNYLDKRRMPDDLAKKFRVGYAPDRQDALTQRLLAKGVPEKILMDVGISAKPESGYPPIKDRFRDRLMFPILDGAGHVVGFGGRVIREGDQRPKYLNSAENELFHKGRILYGYHTARHTVSEKTPPVLVEGYLDVIYAQSAGLSAMAALGTALTETQADLLSRFRQPVLMAYDADQAGRKATLRAAGMLLARDVQLGVLVFPEGRDPAEMVERDEAEELRKLAANPRDAFSFIVETAKSMHPDSVTGQRAAGKLVSEIGSGMRDEILRQKMIQAVADGFGLNPAAAGRMIRPASHRGTSGESASTTASAGRAESLLLGEGRHRLEWSILGVALARPDFMAAAYSQIEDDFSDPDAKLLWDVLAAQYERNHEIDMDELAAAFAEHERIPGRITQLRLKPPIETTLADVQGFKDMLRNLRRARLNREMDLLHARLKAAEAANDADAIKTILDEDRALKEMIAGTTGK